MEILIEEKDFEALKGIAEKQSLDEEDIKRLAVVLEKVGVVMRLKEFVAIKFDEKVVIMAPGMSISLNIDVYEGSIVLNLQVENGINSNVFYVELLPRRKDELAEALEKIRKRSGGFLSPAIGSTP